MWRPVLLVFYFNTIPCITSKSRHILLWRREIDRKKGRECCLAGKKADKCRGSFALLCLIDSYFPEIYCRIITLEVLHRNLGIKINLKLFDCYADTDMKWPLFCKWRSETHLEMEIIWILKKISSKCILIGLIDYMSTLAQLMIYRRADGKPLPDIMILFTYSYIYGIVQDCSIFIAYTLDIPQSALNNRYASKVLIMLDYCNRTWILMLLDYKGNDEKYMLKW